MGVGVLFGILLEYAPIKQIRSAREFSPEVLYYALLPPIIFEAGYTLNKKRFFKNIGTITIFAIFGTFLSTFFIAAFLEKMTQSGFIQVLQGATSVEFLLFGAIISAVDPVSTTSILSHSPKCADPLLPSL